MWEKFTIFVFDMYYIKFDVFFPNSERKKKPTHAPIVKKIHLKCVFGLLQTPVFSDIIHTYFLALIATDNKPRLQQNSNNSGPCMDHAFKSC